MKRTCLQRDINTDKQNACEFHPVEISFKDKFFDSKEIQQVKNFVRIKIRQTLFIILLFFFSGLKGFSQVQISFTKPISDNFIESDLIKEVTFMPLQYEKMGAISPDMELRCEDGNYFILDNKFDQCVYRFSEDGNLLNTIGGQKQATDGNSLPVLNNPVKFNVNPYLEQVEIFSFENSALERYSYNGKKIDQIVFSINPADFTRDSEGYYWIYTGWNNKETQFRLLKTDPKGRIVDKKMRLVSKCTPFENFAFSNYKNQIFMCELLGNSTYKITGNTITETFFLDYGLKNLPPLFHTMNANDSYQFLSHNGYYTIKKYLENDHFAYFFLNSIAPDQRQIYHVIYDKQKQKVYQYYENAAIGAFEKAQALTEDDELVFLVSPRKIRQLSASNADILPPAFSELEEASGKVRNTMIVKIKIESPDN
jgi:hypothetical protein